MNFLSRPSSQIQRQIEASLLNAYELQLHVEQLVQRIKTFEDEAHNAAAEYYAPEDIPAALKFARMSLPSILALKNSAQKNSTENAVTASNSDSTSAPAVNTPDSSDSNNAVKHVSLDNEQVQRNPDFFGVRVPPHRADEANAILDEALSASRKNQKENPYSSDRGKNAWRSHLFVAALEAFFLQNQTNEAEYPFTLSNDVAPVDFGNEVHAEVPDSDATPLPDTFDSRTVPDDLFRDGSEDVLSDDEDEDTAGYSVPETDMSQFSYSLNAESEQSMIGSSDEVHDPGNMENKDDIFFENTSDDHGSYYDDIPFFDDDHDHLVHPIEDQSFRVDTSSFTDDVPEAESLTARTVLLEEERRSAELPAHARVIRPEDVPVSARNRIPVASTPRRPDIPVHAQGRVIQRPDLQPSPSPVIKAATTADPAPVQEPKTTSAPMTRPAAPALKRPTALQPPMRQVGYGNAVPAPDGLDAALEKRRRQEEAAGKPITPEPEVRVAPPRTAPPLRPSFAAPVRK